MRCCHAMNHLVLWLRHCRLAAKPSILVVGPQNFFPILWQFGSWTKSNDIDAFFSSWNPCPDGWNVKTGRFLCWVVTVGLAKGMLWALWRGKYLWGNLWSSSASTEVQWNRFSVNSLEQTCVILDRKIKHPLDMEVPGLFCALKKLLEKEFLHGWAVAFQNLEKIVLAVLSCFCVCTHRLQAGNGAQLSGCHV